MIVTVDGPADVIDRLVGHARAGLERHFPTYAGFIDGTLHRSTDGRRLVQSLRWESNAAYVACRDDPGWERVATTAEFLRIADSGAAAIDVRVYRVVASSPQQG